MAGPSNRVAFAEETLRIAESAWGDLPWHWLRWWRKQRIARARLQLLRETR